MNRLNILDLEIIEDPTDDRLFVFTGLRDQQLRQRREAPGGDMAGLFIAEGDVVIQRALDAGHRLISVIVEHHRTRPLEFEPGNAPVWRMGDAVLQEIVSHRRYRGAMACFARPEPLNPAVILAGASSLLVTEHVNNPTNMGVMIRTAAALGIDAIAVDASSCDPLARRANRVSMGAVFAFPHLHVDSLPDGLEPIEAAGFTTVALTLADDAVPLDRLGLADDAKVAVIVGAEEPGLTPETQARAHHRAIVPMHRGIDSLNVATAAAIALWELAVRGRGG